MIKYLPLVALLVGAQVHADVIAVSDEAQVANMLFNGCDGQRMGMTLEHVQRIANPTGGVRQGNLLKQGYKFAIDYPNVGYNQFFTVVIDQLVNARSKA